MKRCCIFVFAIILSIVGIHAEVMPKLSFLGPEGHRADARELLGKSPATDEIFELVSKEMDDAANKAYAEIFEASCISVGLA